MAVEAVVPLFRAAVDAAEGVLLRMHGQDFAGEAAPAVAAPSPYMAELARLLSHFRCRPGRSHCRGPRGGRTLNPSECACLHRKVSVFKGRLLCARLFVWAPFLCQRPFQWEN